MYTTKMKSAVVFVFVICVVFAFDQKEIDRINNAQSYWKAGHNTISAKGDGYLLRLLGTKLRKHDNHQTNITVLDDIPGSFDARDNWPACPSISAIKNQGDCGSCWAVAAASAASDRICIASSGGVTINLSAENLLSCCTKCWPPHKEGCDGGYPDAAWDYIKQTGLVTGGDYGSGEGCQPYEIPPVNSDTPKCHQQCTNEDYTTPFNDDKHYGKSSYGVPQDVAGIQSEIIKNGPVEAAFQVYADFVGYTSGVYVQTSDTLKGGHAVRILGWGVEGGVNYWLVANSWGTGWGENGTFKIRRGTNECQFESNIFAGSLQQ